MAQAFPKTWEDYKKNPKDYFSDVSMNPANMQKMADAQMQKQQQSSMNTGMPTLDPNAMGQLGGLTGQSQVQQPQVSNQAMTYTPYSAQTPTATASDIDPYSAESIAKFQSYLPQAYKAGKFEYNPETDQSLAVAQRVAMNKVIQDMTKRGRLYGSFTDTQQQQKAQELIPQYEALAYQKFLGQEGLNRQSYTDEYNRMADILGLAEKQFNKTVELTGKTPSGATTLKGLQDLAKLAESQAAVNTERGKTIGQLTDAQKTYFDTVGQELKNVGITYDNAGKLVDIQGKQINNQADLDKAIALDFERKMPNVPMNPDNRRFLDSYSRLSQDPRYADTLQKIRLDNQNINLATLINQAMDSGNTELADALQYLRYEKVYSNPELLLKYGTNYGMSDLKVAKTAKEIAYEQARIVGQEINNLLDESKLFVQQKTENAQIKEKIAKAEEAISDAERARVLAAYAEPSEKQKLANLILTYNKGVQQMQFARNAEGRAQRAEGRAIQKFEKEMSNEEINKTLSKTVNDFLSDGQGVEKDRNEENAVKVYSMFANAGVDPITSLNEMVDRGFDPEMVTGIINKMTKERDEYMAESGNKELATPKGTNEVLNYNQPQNIVPNIPSPAITPAQSNNTPNKWTEFGKALVGGEALSREEFNKRFGNLFK